MSYDGLLTGITARYLNNELSGAKIEKIMQPDPLEIVLVIRTKNGRKKLLLNSSPAGCRVHFTEKEQINPTDAPNFCMLLRKHIQGGRISSVEQIETERIIRFHIRSTTDLGFEKEKILLTEIMGRHSNIVLCDGETNRIIDSVKRVSVDVNRYRQILPGMEYILPPGQGKKSFWTLTKEDAMGLLASKPYDKALLYGVQGLSPVVADMLSEHESADMICDAIFKLREGILDSSAIRPRVYFDEAGKIKDFHAFMLTNLEASCKAVSFDDISKALDFYYSQKEEGCAGYQKREALIKQITGLRDKQLLKKQRLLEDISNSEKADDFRLKADLITANIGSIKAGEKHVTLNSYYDGSDVSIVLDEKLSPAKNAQAYYKKYAKAKISKKEKLLQLENCNGEIEYLEAELAMAAAANGEEVNIIKSELMENGYIRGRKANDRKNKSKPKPRKYFVNGFEVLVGRSNTENDYISFKLGSKEDIWFHTKDIPGSHVLLITKGAVIDEIDADTIYKTAGIAAWFSKASDSENVPVDYVRLRYVKKPAQAKPGMVIFKENRTVWVNPLNPELHSKSDTK